jgi:hypothetical protein
VKGSKCIARAKGVNSLDQGSDMNSKARKCDLEELYFSSLGSALRKPSEYNLRDNMLRTIIDRHLTGLYT